MMQDIIKYELLHSKSWKPTVTNTNNQTSSLNRRVSFHLLDEINRHERIVHEFFSLALMLLTGNRLHR